MSFPEEWKDRWNVGVKPPAEPETLSTAVRGDGLAGRVQQWFRTRTPRERQLRLVETLALGHRRSIALVECDGQRFLAGMSADGVSTLVPIAKSEMALRMGAL